MPRLPAAHIQRIADLGGADFFADHNACSLYRVFTSDSYEAHINAMF